MENNAVIASNGTEEYLEAIYRLEQKTGFARTTELARQLKVVPGSVTNTVERLERRGLITHKPYRGVKLTKKGQKIALNVLRRHRLAERLLIDILHLDWSEAHAPACRLEHAIVPDMIEPLEKTLGHPKTCPHGNPIPTKDGEILEETSESLVNLKQKDCGAIVKITKETPEFLTRLSSLGLTPGVCIHVKNNSSFHGLITIRVGEATYTLDYEMASVIYVKRNE